MGVNFKELISQILCPCGKYSWFYTTSKAYYVLRVVWTTLTAPLVPTSLTFKLGKSGRCGCCESGSNDPKCILNLELDLKSCLFIKRAKDQRYCFFDVNPFNRKWTPWKLRSVPKWQEMKHEKLNVQILSNGYMNFPIFPSIFQGWSCPLVNPLPHLENCPGSLWGHH